MMAVLVSDFRYALRQLRKDAGFTSVAVLILALGIGANTAAFSILDPLLIQKLPVRNPDELVWVNSTGTLGPAEASEEQVFQAYRDKAEVFSSVLAFSSVGPYQLTRNGETIAARGEPVSGNYFTALGLRPYVGRFFSDANDDGRSVVASFEFWRRALHSEPEAIGRVVTLGDRGYTIAGVAPPGFFGVEVGESPELYVRLGGANDSWVKILARLKPGVSILQAQQALDPLLQAMEKTSLIPEVERKEFLARVLITPAARGLSAARTKFSLPSRILTMVVGLLLLIACGNVANLVLARGVPRRREMTIRLALGASRRRVILQLLTESALLAIAGAVAGVVLGQWTSGLVVTSLSTPQLPIVLATGLSVRLLFFTAAVLALTILICGLAPAISATGGELADHLKTQGVGSDGSLRQSRLRQALIVAQVALSLTLLAGAGLLLKSLFNLETFDAGFDRDKVLTVTTDAAGTARAREQVEAMNSRFLERVKQIPGVRSAAYASFTPISGKEVGVNVAVEGYTPRPGETANERFVAVSPGYFETMGIPLLQGRDLREDDRGHAVAIINRTMARRFFGDASPVGRHFRFVEGTRPPLEIIGVVAVSKYKDLREPPTDFFYVQGMRGDLEIRANVPAKTLAGTLPEVLHSIDGNVKITNLRTLRESVDESLHSDRLIATLCGAISILALVLTCAGLYGGLAFEVARRSTEIGIRIAVGAGRRDILRLVVGQGLRLTVLGVFLGIPGALAAGSLLASMLFGVRQTDPLTFCGVCLLFLVASVLACYLPARRALRVAPIVVLRAE